MAHQEKLNNNLPTTLLNSPAIRSMQLETSAYDILKNLGWSVDHSPYYVDGKTGKFREIDITGRKLYKTKNEEEIFCNIVFLLECKSIKDYHIVVTNKCEDQEYVGKKLIEIQLGDDAMSGYSRLGELLNRYAIPSNDINDIIQAVDKKYHPNFTNFFNDYRINSFPLPIFNAFRETNLATVKDMDASVVWKSFLSLLTCIEVYKDLQWKNLEFNLSKNSYQQPKFVAKDIIDYLHVTASHVTLLHPVLIVESTLWELKDSSVAQIPYFRLIFQRLFEDEMWIDVVNKDYFNEYMNKAKEYEECLFKKDFEIWP